MSVGHTSTDAPRPSKFTRTRVLVLALAALVLSFVYALSPDVLETNTAPLKTERKKAHAFVLLDRTGSMVSIQQAVIDGYDGFVAEQRNTGDMKLTLAQFDSHNPFELVHDGLDIHHVPPLTFEPRSTTPLYDAIAKMIIHADKVTEGHSDDVTIVIFTDGAENASRNYDREMVYKLIDDRKANKGWTFVFLGANQDSYQTAGDIGLSKGSTSNYAANYESAKGAWSDISEGMSVRKAKLMAGVLLDRESKDSWMDATSRTAEQYM